MKNNGEKSRLKICVLTGTFFDSKMPARPAITEIFGNYLPLFGHKITWLVHSDKERIFNYNQVKVIGIKSSSKESKFKNFLNKMLFYVREYKYLKKLIQKKKCEIIQVRNSTFEAVVALIVSKKYKIPVVFQYSFPKDFIKYNKKNNVFYFYEILEKKVLKFVLKNVDFIFPISKWMEKELVKKGIPNSKMMSLPLGVNPDRFSKNIKGSDVRKKYGINNEYVLLLYVGTMDKLRDLDVIIEAFYKAKKDREKIKLMMVGKGNNLESIKNLSKSLGLSNDIIFTGNVSYDDVPYYIAASDVCLCPVPPKEIYKVCSPTKLFEYMVMEKPILTNFEIPEQKEIIEKSDAGLLVSFDKNGFSEGIAKILQNPDELKKMGKKGYQWVLKNRFYDKMAHDVEKRFYEIISNN